jgi:transcriptional repressor NrdR
MRFTTYERIEETPLRVVKKNGERVRFDRSRVLQGMMRATEKRPISQAQLESITDRIEGQIQGDYDREVPSSVIGSLIMDELRELDQVSYVRFASVYREFTDVDQFRDELETLEADGS